jgi:DNA-binding SARP family transcriptional activator
MADMNVRDRPAMYMLGAPRLEYNGEIIEMDTRKATALLAYLVLEGGQHGRDTLATLLWPDYDQSGARAALRRTLSVLNKSLGKDVLEISREAIGIREGAELWSDISAFRTLAGETTRHGHAPREICPRCIDPLSRAAGLYRDQFMAGFTLRDSPAFDDWQFFHTESLRRELTQVLERLVKAHSAQRNFPAAIDFARRLLALDPLHEPAHRQLMQLFALAGERSAAIRQYHECVRILNTELGVRPLDETTHLFEQIKSQRLDPGAQPLDSRGMSSYAATQAHTQPAKPAGSLPLVGRDVELSQLRRMYENIKQDGFFIALEGEAGVGKTRLADEFIQKLCSQGASLLLARCYPGEGSLAMAPFLEALKNAIGRTTRPDWSHAVDGPWLAEAARLLPELRHLHPGAAQAPVWEGPGAQLRFFEGLSQVLTSLAAGPAPGILFLDDLQWADETSMDLLTYLVRRLNNRPILILVTWRREDIHASHRLRRLQAEAQRSGRSTLLTLERLSDAPVAELVRIAFREKPFSAEISARIFRETEGLPFFLVEYLSLLAQATPDQIENEWNIPQGVRDLLFARLEQAGETGRQLLQTAAVIGRYFDFELLREASGRSEEETLTTLENLVGCGLIRETPNVSATGREMHLEYDFYHDKIRALIYAETSLPRRRLLHHRLADLLASRARGQMEDRILAGQLAYHYRQAGLAARAATYYRAAAELDRKVYANSEALAHLQAALALGHPDTAGLDEAIGDLHTLRGEYLLALASYQAAMAHTPTGGGNSARLDRKLGNIYHRLGDWDLARMHFETAHEVLQGSSEPSEHSRLLSDWSHTVHRQGKESQAMAMACRALELAESTGDERALAQAHNILGILERSRGDLPAAIGHLERSLAISEHLGDIDARAAALNNLSLVCANSGNLPRALAHTRAALEICALTGDRHREAALHNNLADLYHASQQEEQAMLHLKQAVSIFAEIGATSEGQPNPEIWKLSEW